MLRNNGGIKQPKGAAVDALVLDGDLRQSLVAVRSLGRAGLRSAVLASAPGAPACSSRCCAVRATIADVATDPHGFTASLLRVIDELGPRVVIAGHDGTIEGIRAARPAIEQRTAVALAQEPALDIAVSKTKTLDLARRLGIAIPRGVAAGRGDVRAALREVGLPAVLKPAQSWSMGSSGGERLTCRIVSSVEEGVRAAAELQAAGGSVIVQQWLPGAREAVSVMAVDGEVRAAFAQVAHRTHPPAGGSSVLRESIALADAPSAAAFELVAAAGLDGYSEVEFRRDAEGVPRLMEINSRLSASIEIAVRAGIDFPLLLYLWAAGEPVPEARTYQVGMRMRWLGGDLRSLRETLATQGRPDVTPAARAVAAFAADFFRRAGYDYVSASDPLPMLVATRMFVSDAVGSLRSHGSESRPPVAADARGFM